MVTFVHTLCSKHRARSGLCFLAGCGSSGLPSFGLFVVAAWRGRVAAQGAAPEATPPEAALEAAPVAAPVAAQGGALDRLWSWLAVSLAARKWRRRDTGK